MLVQKASVCVGYKRLVGSSDFGNTFADGTWSFKPDCGGYLLQGIRLIPHLQDLLILRAQCTPESGNLYCHSYSEHDSEK